MKLKQDKTVFAGIIRDKDFQKQDEDQKTSIQKKYILNVYLIA